MITDAYKQYFNAYKEISNWNNNSNWTNIGLTLEVASYFTLVAPFIVLATYKTVILIGYITQKLLPTNTDKKTSEVFLQFQNPPSIPQIYLKSLRNLDCLIQKKILEDIQVKEFKEFIFKLGGIDVFLEKLNKTDSDILGSILLEVAVGDPFTIKYAFLSSEEVETLPLIQYISLPMKNEHVQILKAQLEKFSKLSPNNLLLEKNLSDFNLREINSYEFTNDQIDELINKFGEEIITLLPEEKIKDFIQNNKKMNDISPELYISLFYCLQDENLNKARFSYLSHNRVSEIMKKFAGQPFSNEPMSLLSEAQTMHFFGNLKAADVNQTFYENLFVFYGFGYKYREMFQQIKARFQLIPEEEAAIFIHKFAGQPINLLSETQAAYFFGNLKATDVDQTMFNRLFVSNSGLFTDGSYVNYKERFRLIPIEEAVIFMHKFAGQPQNLLSEVQATYFFSTLKAVDVDQKMYKRLFVKHSSWKSKIGFQLIPKEEAAIFMHKFKGYPELLLSEEQATYFFSTLKAVDVDTDLYNSLFLFANKRERKFQLIPKEEAAIFMHKFSGAPKIQLSEEQATYFFGNLKATDVDQTMFNRLFTYDDCHSYRFDNPTDHIKRFQLISNKEVVNFIQKFHVPKALLSEKQVLYLKNLRATAVATETIREIRV